MAIDNAIQVFSNSEFRVRTIEDNGEIWFVAKDIAEALEYNIDGGMTKYFAHVPDIWKEGKRISTTGGEQEMLCLSEQGVYFFLGRSDKPKALPYQMWIACDVVPAIRKNGFYATPKKIDDILGDPDSFISILQAYKAEKSRTQVLTEQVAVQTQQIAEIQPKASYYDVVLSCKDLLSTNTIAKDYGWTEHEMNTWLEKQGVLFRQGETWLPYHKYVAMRYINVETDVQLSNCDDCDATCSTIHTYWTQKGRLFIYDLMKAAGFLPSMEGK